ncbi:MAG: hypothetical protein NTV16_06700 [Actinobacteria bacterium]|nr:hypothetical protein [Actinomycetota bacterium]
MFPLPDSLLPADEAGMSAICVELEFSPEEPSADVLPAAALIIFFNMLQDANIFFY